MTAALGDLANKKSKRSVEEQTATELVGLATEQWLSLTGRSSG